MEKVDTWLRDAGNLLVRMRWHRRDIAAEGGATASLDEAIRREEAKKRYPWTVMPGFGGRRAP